MYDQLTSKEIELIRNTYWKVLCRWYCKLICWEWPEELLPEEAIEHHKGANVRRRQLYGLIEQKVGRKCISYFWNVHYNQSMDADEFEDWWQAGNCGDKVAAENDYYRVGKIIERELEMEETE